MRQKLESTNVLIKDISDQPQDSRYILFLVGFLGERAGLAVDGVREKDAVMEAWADGSTVAKWNPNMPWALVERARLEWFSVREWMKRLARDSEESKALVKEMLPNGGEEQVVVVGDMGEVAEVLLAQGERGQGYL